jgi:hypothetical protein
MTVSSCGTVRGDRHFLGAAVPAREIQAEGALLWLQRAANEGEIMLYDAVA